MAAGIGYVSVPDSFIKQRNLFPSEKSKSPGCFTPLTFPATKSSLWDHRPVGQSSLVHLSQKRSPVIQLEERTLRIIQRHAQESKGSELLCWLVGSCSTDSDDGGVVIRIDRLDSKRSSNSISPKDLNAGEIIIPCKVSKDGTKPASCVDDYDKLIKAVSQRCTSQSSIDVGHLLSMAAICSYHGNGTDSIIFNIDFDAVLPSVVYRVTPVNPLPIVPTALSKNLGGPLSISEVQGEPKSGFLTMDQTRKLLLVLESDPKVQSLPLVGIWISGIANSDDPFVWASCLRYTFSPALKERVCIPPESFLLVLYSPVHSRPEFYECSTSDGLRNLDFTLASCHDVLQLSKDMIGQYECPVELELMSVMGGGAKLELFTAAMEQFNRQKTSTNGNEVNKPGSTEEMMPRSFPVPHQTKMSIARPSVPEVTLLFDVPSNQQPTRRESSSSKQPPSQSLKPASPMSDYYSPVPQSNLPISSIPTQQFNELPHQMPAPSSNQQSNFSNPYPVQQLFPQYSPSGPYPQAAEQQNFIPQMAQSSQQNFNPQMAPSSQQNFNPQMAPSSQQYYNPQMALSSQQNFIQQMAQTSPQNFNQQMAPTSAAISRQTFNHQGAAISQQSFGDSQNMRYPAQAFAQTMPHFQNSNPNPGLRHQPYQGVRCMMRPPNLIQTNGHFQPNSGFQGNSNKQMTIQNSLQNGAQEPSPQGQRMPVDSRSQPRLKAPRQKNFSRSQQPIRAASLPDVDQLAANPRASNSMDSGFQINDSTELDGSPRRFAIPDDVYRLLRQQDSELKALRQELEELRGMKQKKKNVRENKASRSQQVDVECGPDLVEKCSVAVNTTFRWSPSPSVEAKNDLLNRSVGRQHQQTSHNSSDFSYDGNRGGNNNGDVCTSQQQARLSQVSGTSSMNRKGRGDGSPSGSFETIGNVSFGDVRLQNRSEESIASELIMDMPAYTSLSPEKLNTSQDVGSDGSPRLGESVSTYEQSRETRMPHFDANEMNSEDVTEENEPHEENQHALSSQEFQELIDKVQKLLARHQVDNNDTVAGTTTNDQTAPEMSFAEPDDTNRSFTVVDIVERTKQQLRQMGIDMDQLNTPDRTLLNMEQTMCMLDPAFLPKINYVSMMLDRSSSDLSLEADSIAMKYLKDDQLSELAKVRSSSSKSGQRHDPALGRIVSNGRSDISHYGLPLNQMSFASRKYLERYGLLDGDDKSNDCQPKKHSDDNVDDVSNQGIQYWEDHRHCDRLPCQSCEARDDVPRSQGQRNGNNLPRQSSSTPISHGASTNRRSSYDCDIQQSPDPHRQDLRLSYDGFSATPRQDDGRLFGSSQNSPAGSIPPSSKIRTRNVPAADRTLDFTDDIVIDDFRESEKRKREYSVAPGEQNPMPNRVLDIERLRELPKLL